MAINGVNRDLLITPDLTRIESLDFHLGEQLLRVATEMLENGIVIRERLVPYLIPGKTCRQIGRHPTYQSPSERPGRPHRRVHGTTVLALEAASMEWKSWPEGLWNTRNPNSGRMASR